MRVLDLKASGRESPGSGDLRRQKRCTRCSQDGQDVGVCIWMASARPTLTNTKSGGKVGSTLRPDSRLAFRCQVRQMHRTHRT